MVKGCKESTRAERITNVTSHHRCRYCLGQMPRMTADACPSVTARTVVVWASGGWPYGGLSALLGLLFIMTVPATTIQMGLSALVARREAGGDASFFATTLTRWLGGFLFLGLVLFFFPLFLHPRVA